MRSELWGYTGIGFVDWQHMSFLKLRSFSHYYLRAAKACEFDFEGIQPLLSSIGSMGVLFDLRSFSHQYRQLQ
jgi:hypothetical protein